MQGVAGIKSGTNALLRIQIILKIPPESLQFSLVVGFEAPGLAVVVTTGLSAAARILVRSGALDDVITELQKIIARSLTVLGR